VLSARGTVNLQQTLSERHSNGMRGMRACFSGGGESHDNPVAAGYATVLRRLRSESRKESA
jgi:hypothetical protein